MNTYIGSEITEILALGPRTVHSWTKMGLIKPEVAFKRMRGTKWKYSSKNLFEFSLVQLLVPRLSLKTIKKVLGFRDEIFDGCLKPIEEGYLEYRDFLLLYGMDKDDYNVEFRRKYEEDGAEVFMNGYTSLLIIDISDISSLANLREEKENVE